MTKLLLVCPPYSPFTPTESAVPPLGLACIAAVSRPNAEVRVVDMGCMEALGMDSWTNLINTIDTYHPEIVGIGPLVTSNVHKGMEIARVIKSSRHSPIVVVGGPDPTFTYYQILTSNSDIDVVFLGEAENSFLEFIQYWDKPMEWPSIRGIAFRYNGRVETTARSLLTSQEFNELPRPAWDLFPLQYYAEIAQRAGFAPYLPIESSRGCPLNCIFCACTQLFAHRMKYRSAKSVVDEIESNMSLYGYRRFVFNDDNAGINVNHMINITLELLKRSVRNIQLACSTTVEARIFGDELVLRDLKSAGFSELFMGCESPHPETIAIVGKTHHPDRWPNYIRQAVELCRKVNIASRTNWILGLPTDTKEKFLGTIEFIKELRPDSALVSLIQPYPGTPLAHLIETDPNSIGVYPLTSNPSEIIASKFEPVVYTKWMTKEEMIELAYRFIYSLSPYLEANVSGSPYYIFELWRERRGR